MEDLNPTNPEPDAAAATMNHSHEMQRKFYEQLERPTEAELAGMPPIPYPSREMQRKFYEPIGGAEE
jgi:hypothetical protein